MVAWIACILLVLVGIMAAYAGGATSAERTLTPRQISNRENTGIVMGFVFCLVACAVARYL